MERREITVDMDAFPVTFHKLLDGCQVFDSSCSPQARVWLLNKDRGMFLKRAPKGSLRREAEMTAYVHKKALAAEVLAYESLEQDWLLTGAVPGEDCTHPRYLDDPQKLSALLGEKLRMLHEQSFEGCPVQDHTAQYLAAVEEGYNAGRFDPSYFPDGNITPEDAWALTRQAAPLLKREVLLHGDYCLPNVMLDDWKFSGFIDLDHGCVGDRHIDLYWGCWSLGFNLKTDRYRERFLDAYGKDKVDSELLALVGAFEVFG